MSSLRLLAGATLVLCLASASPAEVVDGVDIPLVFRGGDIPLIRGGIISAPPGAAAPPAAGSEQVHDEPALAPGQVNVRFADGNLMRLRLQQSEYTFVTPYGKLVIPSKEIQLLELAPRVPEEIARQIEESVAKLGSPQYEIREKAAADLLSIGAKGYAVLKRMKSSDLEVSSRLAAIVERIEADLPEEQRNPREADVIHTVNSQITGKLALDEVKAESAQFGEVTLKLADVRDLVFGPPGEAIDVSKLPPAPASVTPITLGAP
jgi:hypothetical protein